MPQGTAPSWLPQTPGPLPAAPVTLCPKDPIIPAAPGAGEPPTPGAFCPGDLTPWAAPGPRTCPVPAATGPGAREPRAPQLQAPSRAPRGRAAASCISLPGLVAVSPWFGCSRLPTLGAGRCPPPSVSPWGSLPHVCLRLPSLLPRLPAPPPLRSSTPLSTPLRVGNALGRFVERGRRVWRLFLPSPLVVSLPLAWV